MSITGSNDGEKYYISLPVGAMLSAGGFPVLCLIFFRSHNSDTSLVSQYSLIHDSLMTCIFDEKFKKNPH